MNNVDDINYDPVSGYFISNKNCFFLDTKSEDNNSEYNYDPVSGNFISNNKICYSYNKCENNYDPVSGNYLSCNESFYSDNNSDNTSDNNSENNDEPKQKLSILMNDLYPSDCDSQCVNLAVLLNYNDDKNESKFADIRLPEIKIKYITLTKLFFNERGKRFSPYVLNKLWKGIKNLSLSSMILDKYEELTGIDRDNISAIKKIQLYKECSIDKLTPLITKVYGLTQHEFNCALGSVDVREDGNICTNIIFQLYFKSLEIGVKITFKFALSDFPKDLIGKFNSENKTEFDFKTNVSCSKSTEIVLSEDYC